MTTTKTTRATSPLLILAPMENITDSPFRLLCRQFGADMVVSEFISSEGLIRDAVKSRFKLTFSEEERPIALQIFGHDVSSMKQAAELAAEANPDFIDLNFGCPVKKVVRKGAGAALLKDIPRMLEMTRVVVKAVNIPVTVKTRTGWDSDHQPIVEVAEQLQDLGIAAITIHGRTAVQQYGGRADWRLIAETRRNPRLVIPVYGNGDITNAVVAKERLEESGVDGVMIGRGSMGNPWIFRDIRSYLTTGIIPPMPLPEERIRVLRAHLTASVEYKGEHRAVTEFRKLYSGYFRGLPHMKEVRMALVRAGTLTDVEMILKRLAEQPAM